MRLTLSLDPDRLLEQRYTFAFQQAPTQREGYARWNGLDSGKQGARPAGLQPRGSPCVHEAYGD